MRNTFTQTNFTSGEVSPRLLGRSDLSRYANGARVVENFVVQKHGGLDRRPGTQFVARSKHSGLGRPDYACGEGAATEVINTVTYGPILTQNAYANLAESDNDAGDVAWTSVTRARYAPNSNSARVESLGLNETSEYLHLTNYGFSIPADAAIVGIKVTPRVYMETASTAQDEDIQLIVGGSRTGDDKSIATLYSSGYTSRDYGSSSDLWGLTPTVAQVNASNFGVALRYERTASSGLVALDACQITVYYRTVSVMESTVDPIDRGVCRLIPFEFSVDQSYVLEFGHLYMRVFTADGEQVLSSGLPYEISTPYAEEEVEGIRFTQSADFLYLCHPDHSPRTLARTADDNWTLSLFSYKDGPYQAINTTADKLMAVSSITPGSVTLTASGAGWGGVGPFLAEHAETASRRGLMVRLKTTGTAWGWGYVTAFSTTLVVTVTLVTAPATTGTTADWRIGSWSDSRGWPEVPTFHAERLWLASTEAEPQTLWASESGIFNSFQPSDVTSEVVADSDGLAFTLSGNQVNKVRWLTSVSRGMLVGTSGGEHILAGTDLSSVITPTSVRISKQSPHGSNYTCRPVEIGNSVLYIQRHSRKVFESTYKFDFDQHISNDLTVMSEHLGLNRFVDLVSQYEPYSLVWLRDADGDLFSLTFNPEQEVTGWATHVIGGDYLDQSARVDSICSVVSSDEDRLWMVVRREINGRVERYIEILSDFFEEDELLTRTATFLDSCLSYDGWNYDRCALMTLTADSTWDEGDTGTLTATGHTPFTADSVGRYYRIDAGEYEEEWIEFKVTGYTSTTVVDVEFMNDVPAAIRETEVFSWALLASTVTGLDHLEGQTVSILADGGTHPDTAVLLGEAALEVGEFPTRAATVHVGLSYTSTLRTLPVSPDSFGADLRSRVKSAYRASIRFHRSVGGSMGTSADDLDPLPSRLDTDVLGEPPGLFTGTRALNLESRYDVDPEVYVVQADPLPMQLLSISYEVDASEA